MSVRCVAILCVRNEQAHVGRAIAGLVREGIEVAVIDHGSTDRTREICEGFLGQGLIRIEDLAWAGAYDQTAQLQAKQQLIGQLDHDWIIHADADEWMHTRMPGESLAEGIERMDRLGCNAINFEEFVFLPGPDTLDEPTDCRQSMLSYYFFEPSANRLMRAWKRAGGFTNVDSGGHVLRGAQLVLAPEAFVLRHYIVLTQAQAVEKYSSRIFAAGDLEKGWHGNRLGLVPERLRLPDPAVLQRLPDWPSVELDRSQPRRKHFWDWSLAERGLQASEVQAAASVQGAA